jgi:hypothetical protein
MSLAPIVQRSAFGRLLLGHLDLLNASFLRTDLNPKTAAKRRN